MNDLVVKWSRDELPFGGEEHIQLVEVVPYLTPKELEFIISRPISDGVREAAMREIKIRALIKSPWRDRLTWVTLIASLLSSALAIWNILSKH